MRKQYGKGKGEDVFYAMMNKMGGKKAAKYHKKPSKKKKSK